jgi:hypothetical protein
MPRVLPVVTAFIIERFSTIENAVCLDGGGESRFVASLGMRNTVWPRARS